MRWKYFTLQREQDVLAEIALWGKSQPWVNASTSWHDVPLSELKSLPVLMSELDRLDVRAVYAAAIVKTSDMPAQPIHNDFMPGVMARLLFPVMNTVGSYTVFYNCKEKPSNGTCDDNTNIYYEFDRDKCVEIDRVQTVRPIILRVDRPHAIVSESNLSPRITLSIRLDKDPIRWLTPWSKV